MPVERNLLRYVIAIILLGIVSLAAIAAFYATYFWPISNEHRLWGEFGSYFGGIGGTIIAALALVALAVTARLQSMQLSLERERHNADSLLNEVDENLGRAFDALSRGGAGGDLPNNSRLAWLTAARLILVADELSDQVPRSYHSVLESKQLYWRYQFFDLLDPLDRVGEDFWADSVDNLIGWKLGEREPISEKSAKVIHDWIYAMPRDPMENRLAFTDEEIEKLRTFRWKSLGSLLQGHRERFRRAQERRNDER